MEFGRSLTGMSTGSFYRCIKQLNPKLRICDIDGSDRPAGLYYIDSQEGWISVCGVDKKWVPLTTTVDEVGHILKSGWVRVVKILLYQGLTTREKVRRIWPGFFESRVPATTFSNVDPIFGKINKYVHEELDKRGTDEMTDDQILEVADMIHKNDTEAQKIDRDKAKFDLDKATGKNKTYV